jgi:hypothetical protein
MCSIAAQKAAHRIQVDFANSAVVDDAHIATIIEEELGFADAITALRKCDHALEQLGVAVNERDFVLKAIGKLEGAQTAAPAPEVVIGTAP